MAVEEVWLSGRGFERLLAQETNISDLIQFCSERDASPWMEVVGFLPTSVDREVRLRGPRAGAGGIADLVLQDESSVAVIEVKLGHTMSEEQQETYEMQPDSTRLVLVALEADRRRIAEDMAVRWSFVGLSSLFDRWSHSSDPAVSAVASEAAAVLHRWDKVIAGVFESAPDAVPLATVKHKFIARLVTRRIHDELRDRGLLAFAGVTSGGGLALVQAWAPIAGDSGRFLQAEVRWREAKVGGELRFGVDFSLPENADARREAFMLATLLEEAINATSLRSGLSESEPLLAQMIDCRGDGRPKPKGDWSEVVARGFKTRSNPDGVAANRRSVKPGFYGDGTQRFQAMAEINFARASAQDVVEIIDATLTYLQDAHLTLSEKDPD